MKPSFIFTLLSLILLSFLSTSCQTPPEQVAIPAWYKTVDDEVHKLGSFNWVIVAEPAFPALSRSGVITVTTPASTTSALDSVLQSIDSHSHVRPNIHLVREANAITENDTPGIDAFRAQLKNVLAGRETQTLTNDTLNLLITDARKNYRILVIKTTTSLPYTSIFLELESGYWDGVSETALRKRMRR